MMNDVKYVMASSGCPQSPFDDVSLFISQWGGWIINDSNTSFQPAEVINLKRWRKDYVARERRWEVFTLTETITACSCQTFRSWSYRLRLPAVWHDRTVTFRGWRKQITGEREVRRCWTMLAATLLKRIKAFGFLLQPNRKRVCKINISSNEKKERKVFSL